MQALKTHKSRGEAGSVQRNTLRLTFVSGSVIEAKANDTAERVDSHVRKERRYAFQGRANPEGAEERAKCKGPDGTAL